MIIREMKAADIEFAYECVRSVGWVSEGRELFIAFLAHDPQGCFLAEVDGRPAGICIATGYERNGFIGELVVTRKLRIMGLGKHLLAHAIAYLQDRGMANIYLDGDLNAVPFYEVTGFRKICKSLRFKGSLTGREHEQVRQLRKADLDWICAIDKEYFGDDRGFFLHERIKQFPDLCLVSERDGVLTGYLLAKGDRTLTTVGPWVVLDEEDMPLRLLDHFAHLIGQTPLRIGVLGDNHRAVELIRSLGTLEETTFSWYMVRGEESRLGVHPRLFAIGSGAKG